MADNTITFKIGSVFTGDGFKRLKKSVNDANSGVSRGMAAAEQLNSALGGMNSAAGKCAQATMSMAQAILSGNIAMIAAQGVVIAINAYYGAMRDRAEEAKKKVEELAAAVKAAFSEKLAASVRETTDEMSAISSDFERLTKHATAFAAALEGVRSSEAKGGVIALETEKLNAMLAAHSEEEAKAIEATYNMRIAIEKRAAVEAEGTAKVEAAQQAVVDAQQKIANLDEQIAVAQKKREELREVMAVARASEDSNWVKIQQQINELAKKEAALEQKKLDTEAEIDVLREKEKQVRSDANNATATATNAVLQLQVAEKRAAEAVDAHAREEVAAAGEAEAKRRASEAQRAAQEEATEIQKQVNQAAKDLRDAETAYKKALDQYNSRFLENTVEDNLKGVFGKGLKSSGAIPVKVANAIQGTVADHAVDEAIRNHLVNSVKDADKVARDAARQARDEANKNSGQRAKEAARYERIMNTNEKARSAADKKFLEKYNKILAAREADKKALEDAKKAVDKAKDAQIKSEKHLDDIVKKLGALGLK